MKTTNNIKKMAKEYTESIYTKYPEDTAEDWLQGYTQAQQDMMEDVAKEFNEWYAQRAIFRAVITPDEAFTAGRLSALKEGEESRLSNLVTNEDIGWLCRIVSYGIRSGRLDSKYTENLERIQGNIIFQLEQGE